ncbi:hypothetical protein CALCODRAFT_225606 [Calocera cornea HHB12733]|uniref:Uncharacterized protein n=1 Tax=Calocera cornea HHB12733 TaxID=1353952 RepID=A0A165C115_9BASI|nr:hypothetical protein CALCODRAFT_225606 [Calocera cornea HHB12733]
MQKVHAVRQRSCVSGARIIKHAGIQNGAPGQASSSAKSRPVFLLQPRSSTLCPSLTCTLMQYEGRGINAWSPSSIRIYAHPRFFPGSPGPLLYRLRRCLERDNNRAPSRSYHLRTTSSIEKWSAYYLTQTRSTHYSHILTYPPFPHSRDRIDSHMAG